MDLPEEDVRFREVMNVSDVMWSGSVRDLQ